MVEEASVAGSGECGAGCGRLVAADVPDDYAGGVLMLALIKSVPGNVSLYSMLTEIRRLRAVRAVGLPA